jgi:molecular chaperone HscC
LHFGIDLGTTNSLIAVFRDGSPELIPNALGQVLTPSVVALRDGQLVVGDAARAIAIADPANAAALFKRAMGTDRDYRLGGKGFRAPELSAMVLASLKSDAETALGVTVSDVVISVPAYFNELQRKAVRAAGRIAGLNVTRLINEPTAAALSYGLHERDGETRILVFDLGGGTFDISVLELFEGVMEVRASAGDAFLGGEDFTEALARHIAQTAALDPHDATIRPALLSLAEQAKRQLATAPEVTLKAQIDGTAIDQTLTRDRFEEVTAQLLSRLGGPLDRALSDAGLTPDQIDRLILVGGATRMQPVRAYAGRRLRQLPVTGVDPDQAVALGAAVQAALVARDAGLDDVVMTDVSAFTLGVDTAHKLGTGWKPGYFSPIIERNTVIPASREQVFSTIVPGQTEIHLNIYQGESPLVAGNLNLGQIRIPVPKNLEGEETVTVRFTYDVSGLLEVEVTANSTGKKVNLVITQLAGEMSEAEIKAALKKLASLKVHPRSDAENLHLKSRLEAAFAMARGDARDWVKGLLVSFDSAIDSQDKPAIAKLRTDLHEALDRFEADHVR